MPARPTWTSWTPANSTAVWRCKPIRRSSPPSSPPPTITGGLLTILQQPDLIWYDPLLSCWEEVQEFRPLAIQAASTAEVYLAVVSRPSSSRIARIAPNMTEEG